MTRRGDVVILDVPYSDRSGSKVRPALVVQADTYNQQLQQTVITIITSSQRRMVGAKTQVFIDLTTPDGRKSGLRSDSVVQCNHLVTIPRNAIHNTIGRLSAPLMYQVDDCLKESLGIP